MLSANKEDGAGICPACGRDISEIAVRGKDYEYGCRPGIFTLIRCLSCAHVRVFPMPAADAIPDLYPDTYYTVNPESPLYVKGFIHKKKIGQDVFRIKGILSHIGIHPPSIADIGCGDAARLFKLAEDLGKEAEFTGVDLKFQPSLLGRAEAAGIKLFALNVEHGLGPLENGNYSLIIMSQFIEHLRDPEAALQTIRPKLHPKGRILIETPNLAGLDYHLFKGKYWGGYHIPRHLHLFTKSSFSHLLRRCGFQVISEGDLPSPGFWIISLRNALGLSSAQYGGSLFEFLNFSNLPVVGFFTLLDMLTIQLGLPTSNQFVIAKKG